MLRILKFTTNKALGPQEGLQALEATKTAAGVAAKLPGVRSCTLYLGAGALVFAAESESYAVADAALADPAIQAAFGRLGWEFGYGINSDEFYLDPEQVYPFIRAQEYAVASS